jgi:hypothetical protein
MLSSEGSLPLDLSDRHSPTVHTCCPTNCTPALLYPHRCAECQGGVGQGRGGWPGPRAARAAPPGLGQGGGRDARAGRAVPAFRARGRLVGGGQGAQPSCERGGMCIRRWGWSTHACVCGASCLQEGLRLQAVSTLLLRGCLLLHDACCLHMHALQCSAHIMSSLWRSTSTCNRHLQQHSHLARALA